MGLVIYVSPCGAHMAAIMNEESRGLIGLNLRKSIVTYLHIIE